MPSRAEVYKRLQDALKAKGVARPCAVCGNPTWTIGPAYVVLPALKDPRSLALSHAGLESYPLFPINCNNCGNTHFLNLLVLGIGDLSSIVIDD